MGAKAGRIDMLFVDAGGGSMLPLGEITEAQHADTVGRNVKGVPFTVRKALPLPAPGASVILAGSTAATEGTGAFKRLRGLEGGGAGLRPQLDPRPEGPRRPGEHALGPGATRTPGLVALAGPDAAHPQGLLDRLAAKIPMGRVGEPDEIAEAAVFLASDDASFVAGLELFVEGGQAQIRYSGARARPRDAGVPDPLS